MKRPLVSDAGMEFRSDLASAVMVREIENAIGSGALKPGDRLPSEALLKAKYNISVGSVRRGMDRLVQAGMVNRRRGSGTYIQAVPTPTPAPSHIAADTVLFALKVHHAPTHPFFGERARALKNRLNALAWKVEFFGNGQMEASRNYTLWSVMNMPRLIHQLKTDRHVAGVIVDRFTVEAVVAAIGSRLPCLCLTATDLCPFVDYRWEEERVKAVRLAVEAGARRLWIVGEGMGKEMLLKRLGYPPGFLELRCTPILQEPVQTSTAHAAYQEARIMLKGKGASIDGIVMGSEFHAQGVLDALVGMRAADVRHLRLVAMINKESRLNTTIPITTVVADGAAAGVALADLLHQQITMPEHAPEFAYLSTTVWAANGWPRPHRPAERIQGENRQITVK